MKYKAKFRRAMSAVLSAALALSLAVPSFALEGKEVKGEPAVDGDSEVTVQVLCDHGHTHWEDNGDGTHDEICDDCGDVVTDDEPHSDDDGNGVCDKCGENSHQVLIASIPVVLPIMAKVDGSVTVPNNAEIANLTEGRVIRVKDLDVTLSGGWSLVDGNTTFTEADKGSKLLAMGFRGTPVAADGSMDMTQSDWSIVIDGSLPLEMRAAIPAQAQKFAESSIGKVTFTLDWAEGSVDPEPEPEPELPVEEVPTNIDRTKMFEAFGGQYCSDGSAENRQVQTLRFDKGNPSDSVDISVNQDRTVLASLNGTDGVIWLNNSYLSGSLAGLFYNYKNAQSINVSDLDTRAVTDMNGMFDGCEALVSLDVSGFDTSNVTNMGGMFRKCYALTSLDVSGFDTSNVVYMNEMFNCCQSLTSLDVSGFDTGNVAGMSGMFEYCSSLTTLDVSSFDTSKVASMYLMFRGCNALTALDVSNFNTSNVTNMSIMFQYCSSLTTLDVSGFDTSKVTNMRELFSGCLSLIALDVSNFDTSKVTNMGSMFTKCSALTSLDVSNFDTSKVTTMDNMFDGCSSLTSLDVSNFVTSKVQGMNRMFFGCSSLTSLDVSNFNLDTLMFSWSLASIVGGCSNLTTLYVKDEAAKAKISGAGEFPSTCTIIVGSHT